MIRFLTKMLYMTTVFCIIFAVLAIFLLATTPGLHTVMQISRLYLPGTIQIKRLEGSLLHQFTAYDLEYQYKNINIKMHQLTIQWHPGAKLNTQNLSAQWFGLDALLPSTQHLLSPTGTASAQMELPALKLKLDSQINTSTHEDWQMKASAQGTLPWQWTVNASLIQNPNKNNKLAGLHGNFSLRGVIHAANEGNLLLNIHPGYYQIPDASIPAIPYKGGTVRMILSPEKLSSIGSLILDPHKKITLNFNAKQFNLATGFHAKQRIHNELKLEIDSLDFLHNISPEINKLNGQIVASIYSTGTWGAIRNKGKLNAHQVHFIVPALGLHVDSMDLSVKSQEKQWQAIGTISSAGNKLNLKGNGDLNPHFSGDFALTGNNFPLMQTTEYTLNITPQLSVHITPDTRVISGSILIPYAQIKPQSFANSLSLPDEIVYKKAPQKTPSPLLNYTVDINIRMGKNVAVEVKGLKGHVDGTIQVKQQAEGLMNAYGELSIRDGTYKAYGQELAIQQGQLIFTGGPITSPGINLRASKKINNTNYSGSSQLFDLSANSMQNINLGDRITLGVEVTGRLTSPKVQLYSDPAILSQADILSMLVLGRPASQANKAGGQLLLAAISSMNVGSTNTTQLLEQLKQSTGFDFDVQTNTNYNQSTNTVSDSTSFVVGKSLSKRLYLSYNIGLSQTDTNILTLKYLLNKFFSIQISTSETSSAIDVLYTSNKRRLKKL